MVGKELFEAYADEPEAAKMDALMVTEVFPLKIMHEADFRHEYISRKKPVFVYFMRFCHFFEKEHLLQTDFVRNLTFDCFNGITVVTGHLFSLICRESFRTN